MSVDAVNVVLSNRRVVGDSVFGSMFDPGID